MRKRTRYILIGLALIVVVGLVLRARRGGPKIAAGSYLVLAVNGAYAEAPPPDLLGRVLSRREQSLIDLLTMIRTAQVDTRIKGLVLRISLLETGWAKTQDIRDALLEFKKTGKPVVALLEQEVSASNKEY